MLHVIESPSDHFDYFTDLSVVPRFSHVMAVGGFGAENDVEIVNLNSDGAPCFKPKQCPLKLGSTGTLIAGTPLVCEDFDSGDCYSYDSINDQWNLMFSTNVIRYQAAGIQLSEDQFWIIGGSTDGVWLSTSELCSMVSKSCSRFVDLPEILNNPKALKINNKEVILLSSENGHAWLFSLNGNYFSQLPDMLESRNKPALGLINEFEVVVAGGVDSKTSEILDLSTKEWKYGPELPVNYDLCCASSVQYEDSFIVLGGFDQAIQNKIIKFDPVRYEWIELEQTLMNARSNFPAIIIPDYCGNPIPKL